MNGYQNPPRDTRFKKGQSGNPKGRPKGSGALNPASAVALEAARRKVTIREGGITRELDAVDAIQLAQQKSALGGSALAQKHFLDRYERAEAARRESIEAENERWTELVAKHRFIIAEAERNGVSPPRIFPHPDDVLIDPESGVSFVGPTSEQEEENLQKVLRLRDTLWMQYAFDRRSWGPKALADPELGPGSAGVLAHLFDRIVPKRRRLDDAQVLGLLWRCECMTKRELTKALYNAWRSVPLSLPRGTTFPSISVARQAFLAAAQAQLDARSS